VNSIPSGSVRIRPAPDPSAHDDPSVNRIHGSCNSILLVASGVSVSGFSTMKSTNNFSHRASNSSGSILSVQTISDILRLKVSSLARSGPTYKNQDEPYCIKLTDEHYYIKKLTDEHYYINDEHYSISPKQYPIK
jgi:hypothetical protein